MEKQPWFNGGQQGPEETKRSSGQKDEAGSSDVSVVYDDEDDYIVVHEPATLDDLRQQPESRGTAVVPQQGRPSDPSLLATGDSSDPE